MLDIEIDIRRRRRCRH